MQQLKQLLSPLLFGVIGLFIAIVNNTSLVLKDLKPAKKNG